MCFLSSCAVPIIVVWLVQDSYYYYYYYYYYITIFQINSEQLIKRIGFQFLQENFSFYQSVLYF